MTLILELPRELEHELENEAEQVGLSLSEYALRLLRARAMLSVSPKTGADLVAYWQNAGLIGTRPDISDSQEHARQLRQNSVK
ncbi:MAG: hypothetical protein H6658_20255 [Ardenticatenaceae bacterium]|nr:hypothetical protein [Ardenticatenaceae bacterium]